LRQHAAIVVDGHIAKGVEAEFDLLHDSSEPTELAVDSADEDQRQDDEG
jgi:hypothetical protein